MVSEGFIFFDKIYTSELNQIVKVKVKVKKCRIRNYVEFQQAKYTNRTLNKAWAKFGSFAFGFGLACVVAAKCKCAKWG